MSVNWSRRKSTFSASMLSSTARSASERVPPSGSLSFVMVLDRKANKVRVYILNPS